MTNLAEESKALMRRVTEEIWNQRRLELIDELVSEDFVDHIEAPGLEGTGRERYRSHVAMTLAWFSDFQNVLEVVIGDGDIAVSYGRTMGTQDGEMMGMPPTGKRVDCETFGMLRFKDGQLVERWGLADNMAMMQQLGLFG
jgi:predicted ester cyclase